MRRAAAGPQQSAAASQLPVTGSQGTVPWLCRKAVNNDCCECVAGVTSTLVALGTISNKGLQLGPSVSIPAFAAASTAAPQTSPASFVWDNVTVTGMAHGPRQWRCAKGLELLT